MAAKQRAGYGMDADDGEGDSQRRTDKSDAAGAAPVIALDPEDVATHLNLAILDLVGAEVEYRAALRTALADAEDRSVVSALDEAEAGCAPPGRTPGHRSWLRVHSYAACSSLESLGPPRA